MSARASPKGRELKKRNTTALTPLRDRKARDALLKSIDVAEPPETIELTLEQPFGLELNEHHRVFEIDPAGNAHAAGLLKLDRIVSVDGVLLGSRAGALSAALDAAKEASLAGRGRPDAPSSTGSASPRLSTGAAKLASPRASPPSQMPPPNSPGASNGGSARMSSARPNGAVLLVVERPPKSAYKAIVLHEYSEGSTAYRFASPEEASPLRKSSSRKSSSSAIDGAMSEEGEGEEDESEEEEDDGPDDALEIEAQAMARLGLAADVILTFPLNATEEARFRKAQKRKAKVKALKAKATRSEKDKLKAKIAKEAAKNIHAKTEEADLVHLGLEEGAERAKSGSSPKSGGTDLERAKSSGASLVGSATDLLGSAGDMAGDSIAELSSRRVEEQLKEWARLRQIRSDVVLKLRKIGLTCVCHKTRDGRFMIVKVTAPQKLLEVEAQRLSIEMQLKPEFAVHEPNHPDVPTYADFEVKRKDKFQTKGGRLFSSLERQRLVYSIMEASADHGGAEVDIDELIAQKAFGSCFPLHSAERESGVLFEWIHLRVWPFIGIDGKRRRLMPDLGLMQQPIAEVRDYFGEKIAFYFAWLEHYTQMLLILMSASIAVAVLQVFFLLADNQRAQAIMVPVYSVVVAIWVELALETWKRKNAELVYKWDVTDFEEEEASRPEYLRAFHEGPWAATRKKWQIGKPAMYRARGFYDTTGTFIEHDDAPIEYVFNESARYRSPTLLLGIPFLLITFIIMLVVTLAILTFRMIGTFGSDFKDDAYFNPTTAPIVGGMLNALWITVMNAFYRKVATYLNNLQNHRTDTQHEDALIIKVMLFQFANSYAALFYIAFVKGIISPEIFGSFGYIDPSTSKPYTDACGVPGTNAWNNVNPAATDCSWSGGLLASPPEGCDYVVVRGDCMQDLYIQMLSYTLAKPAYELFLLQMMLPMFLRKWKQRKLKKSLLKQIQVDLLATVNEVGEAAVEAGQTIANAVQLKGGKKDVSAAEIRDNSVRKLSITSGRKTVYETALYDFHENVENQREMGTFAGTLAEYNPKVIQFGYIAMFSAACPPAALFAALANILELRFDARKVTIEMRRPRYAGAEDIGTWQYVLGLFSWAAIVVNVMLICFTSRDLREALIIPYLAESDDCVINATNPALISDHAAFYGKNNTFTESCVETYMDCYTEIGGVEWLSGARYLLPNSTVSQSYLHEGLCDETSLLYNALHCEVCTVRVQEVTMWGLYIFICMEHLLILLKVLLAAIVPDKPHWVVRSEAKVAFMNRREQQLEAEQHSAELSSSRNSSSEERREAELEEAMQTIELESETGDGGELQALLEVQQLRASNEKDTRSRSVFRRKKKKGTSTAELKYGDGADVSEQV